MRNFARTAPLHSLQDLKYLRRLNLCNRASPKLWESISLETAQHIAGMIFGALV